MVVITLGQEGPTVGINFDWENVGGLNQWLLKRSILLHMDVRLYSELKHNYSKKFLLTEKDSGEAEGDTGGVGIFLASC